MLTQSPNPPSERDDSLKQYIIDEFLEDYQEGRMTRRDALKRLVGLVGSATVAAAMLAACAPAAAPAPIATSAPPPPTNLLPTSVPAATAAATSAATTAAAAPPATAAGADPTLTTEATAPVSVNVSPDDPAIKAGAVQFPGDGGATLMGYLSQPSAPGTYPAVLVAHENRGLTPYIQDVTRQLAKAGYVALAVDLLSRQGGTNKVDASQVPGALGNMPPDQIIGDYKSAVAYLKTQPEVKPDRLGMMGFCFGGGVTWRVITQIPELKAAVPFYGPNPPMTDVPNIQAAVLGLYGALDQRIDSGIPAIEQAMKQNNKTFEYMVFPGANHAFHNDTGGSYNAQAAADAWAKALAWFGKYLNS